MAACVAGWVYVKADGRQFSIGTTVTVSPNQLTRESVVGLDGFHGYSATYRAPYIEFEAINRPEFPLTDVQTMTDATITVETETGEVWVLRNAFQAADLEQEMADATVTVRFEGPEMVRQGA